VLVRLSASPEAATNGQLVSIDSSATSFANLPKELLFNRSFTREWTCPYELQQVCDSHLDQNVLRIEYADFLSSGLQFWTLYEFSMKAEANFTQGNGLKYSLGKI